MKYLKRKRMFIGHELEVYDDDPLSGVANLFDVGLVFIVGLMFALLSVFHVMDILSPESNFTIVKQGQNEQMEIIVKKGKEIKVHKLTKKQAQGEGDRLGTAYRLKNGRVIYVPDEE